MKSNQKKTNKKTIEIELQQRQYELLSFKKLKIQDLNHLLKKKVVEVKVEETESEPGSSHFRITSVFWRKCKS